jgi:hypothetical protein
MTTLSVRSVTATMLRGESRYGWLMLTGLWVASTVSAFVVVLVVLGAALYVADLVSVLNVRPSAAECGLMLCVGSLASQGRRGR